MTTVNRQITTTKTNHPKNNNNNKFNHNKNKKHQYKIFNLTISRDQVKKKRVVNIQGRPVGIWIIFNWIVTNWAQPWLKCCHMKQWVSLTKKKSCDILLKKQKIKTNRFCKSWKPSVKTETSKKMSNNRSKLKKTWLISTTSNLPIKNTIKNIKLLKLIKCSQKCWTLTMY